MDGEGLQDAFLLHRKHFRETSLLLEVFTRNHGRLWLVAKGALRGRSGRFSVLQTFLPLSMGWTLRGEPPVLTQVESRGNLISLSGKSLFCGFYLNELLQYLLPLQDPHPNVFDLYAQSLMALSHTERVDRILRIFETNLLEELGYGLQLDFDYLTGDALSPDIFYQYDLEQGPTKSQSPNQGIKGSVLIGMKEGNLTEPDLRQSKQLMRQVLQHYLGGKPLKSRDLFKYSKT